MGMFSYGGRGTYINGFLTFIERNNPELEIKSNKDLNNHLIAIRKLKEPKKPVSKHLENNSFYIQENYDWDKDVKTYFNSLKQK